MRRTVNVWENLDWTLVILFLMLLGLGWINIYSAVYHEDMARVFSMSERYGRQLIWIGFSLVLVMFVMLIDAKFFSFFAYLIYGLSILSLILVLLVGTEINSSKSWFTLGNFQIQPAEFAKFAAALALARFMSSYNFRIHRWGSLWRMAMIILLPSVLILFQPDMGSALVYISLIIVLFREGFSGIAVLIGLMVIILFFLAMVLDQTSLILALVAMTVVLFGLMNRSIKYLALGTLSIVLFTLIFWILNNQTGSDMALYFIVIAGILASLFFNLYFIFRYRVKHAILLYSFLILSVSFTYSVDYVFNQVLTPYQQKRINVLLGIESDPFGDGYNVNQSKIAIGSGGFSGKGFLRGTQTKFRFVPEQTTDFIFCTVGEEWGFVGSTLVVGLYLLFLLRILYLAEKQRSVFSRIYGYGVFSIFLSHVLINIGMTIGLVPVIGIPLPFFSYGGSSLWAFTLLLFIFIRLDASRMELVA